MRKQHAIDCLLRATEGMDLPNLVLRSDNGSQFSSSAFMESMKALGIRQEFIANSTPEQQGHIESFHSTLKTEYIWVHGVRQLRGSCRIHAACIQRLQQCKTPCSNRLFDTKRVLHELEEAACAGGGHIKSKRQKVIVKTGVHSTQAILLTHSQT